VARRPMEGGSRFSIFFLFFFLRPPLGPLGPPVRVGSVPGSGRSRAGVRAAEVGPSSLPPPPPPAGSIFPARPGAPRNQGTDSTVRPCAPPPVPPSPPALFCGWALGCLVRAGGRTGAALGRFWSTSFTPFRPQFSSPHLDSAAWPSLPRLTGA